MKKIKKLLSITLIILMCFPITVIAETNENTYVELSISAPSAILMEASTGKVIYEKNPDEQLSPASITKIMTLLLIFEAIKQGRIAIEDEVTVSTYASSMGGSQVYLAEGEVQSVETLIKCITIASGNDASVAMAEYLAGSESEFVRKMNEKAKELGMSSSNFEDCCGLTNSTNHYTTARDVAIMSRELITKYPEIYNYTKIWMEDITHTTRNGSSQFTLSSTNKLIKQYQWSTGLKTGSTNLAKYCYSGTANKNGIDLIAVVMAAPDYKVRFSDAVTMLEYGYSVSKIYKDENQDVLKSANIKGSIKDSFPIEYEGGFQYLDTMGSDLSGVTKEIRINDPIEAPIKEGEPIGEAIYMLGTKEIGSINIISMIDVKKAQYKDYVKYIMVKYLF
ncbi:MAG TPA: D-alanyl-D-alanine carboxypeptidase family protein [Lachnospiraceae bacterium]|nr:D-alanyl-D-alanine carboxypeptidase family protein [Lachnospiraceae bacterium]